MSRFLRAIGDVLPVVAAGVAFVIAWKILVVVGGYKPFVLPSPETVFARFVRGWTDGTICTGLAGGRMLVTVACSLTDMILVSGREGQGWGLGKPTSSDPGPPHP